VRLPQINPAPDEVYPSKDFSAVLKRAQQDQKKRGDTYLGVDMLLLALLGDSEISAAIAEAGLTKNSIESALKDVRPEVRVGRSRPGGGCSMGVWDCRA
jgi:ATP-dependent Clp protease ATP-binding subunit ClpB